MIVKYDSIYNGQWVKDRVLFDFKYFFFYFSLFPSVKVLSITPEHKVSESAHYKGLYNTIVELAHHIHHVTKSVFSGGSGGIGQQASSDSDSSDSKLFYDEVVIECHDGYIPHHRHPACGNSITFLEL